MKRSRRPSAQFAVFLWLLLAMAPRCRAANADAAAADLARQISAATGPGAISLTIRNNSSIAADQIPAIRRSLINGLANLGVTVHDRAATDTSSAVRVTLSQSARQGVWVAEIQQGTEVRVVMVNVADLAPAARPQQVSMALRKTFQIALPDPILDAELIALPGDLPPATHLLVLSPEKVTLYRRSPEAPATWLQQQSFVVPHERPWPRDVRGRLEVDAAGLFKAYLPGVICSASQSPAVGAASIALSCADSDDPWPVGSFRALYNSGRNYYTGVTIPGQGAGLEAFYSAADLTSKRGDAVVFSEVGGQVRLYDGSSLKTLNGARDWGSDVAGIASGCGSGAQLLATASGAAAESKDSLLAYEIEGRNAIPISAPLPLDAPVVALWPSSPATASPSVTVILEQQQPLLYEAYSVSVDCN